MCTKRSMLYFDNRRQLNAGLKSSNEDVENQLHEIKLGVPRNESLIKNLNNFIWSYR